VTVVEHANCEVPVGNIMASRAGIWVRVINYGKRFKGFFVTVRN
jgi:hypothetical protein